MKGEACAVLAGHRRIKNNRIYWVAAVQEGAHRSSVYGGAYPIFAITKNLHKNIANVAIIVYDEDVFGSAHTTLPMLGMAFLVYTEA